METRTRRQAEETKRDLAILGRSTTRVQTRKEEQTKENVRSVIIM
jgi:hypothetical protein